MFNQTQAFREYLNRRQSIIDSEKPKETSCLFNEKTFYKAFIQDLLCAKKEIIIYSPFVSKLRTDYFKQTFERLRKRNVEIFIFTRPIEEHESILQQQIECALKRYEDLGISIFYLTGSIHEKIAIIDREILWEGSLNILSQRTSKEMMRRTSHQDQAMQVMFYLGLNRKLADSYKLKYERMYQNLIGSRERETKCRTRMFLLGIAVVTLTWLFIKIFFNDFNILFLIWKFWMNQ